MKDDATTKLSAVRPEAAGEVEGTFLNADGKPIKYEDSSQASYYFDCDGDNGNSKGSFCSILQRLKYQVIEVTENGKKVKKLKEIDYPNNVIPFNEIKSKETLPKYYILTAAHNLGNKIGDGTTIKDIYGNVVQKGKKSPFYKLIKDASNYIELELIADYRTDGYDAAVLQIKEIKEVDVKYFSDDVYKKNPDESPIKFYKKVDKKYFNIQTGEEANELNDENTVKLENELKNIQATDFYVNAIKFENNYYKDEKSAKDEPGFLVGYMSKKGLNETFKYENSYDATNKNDNDKKDFFAVTNSGIGGDSGGTIFSNNPLQLLGIYLGDFRGSDEFKGRCRQYYSIADLIEKYNIK